MSAYKGHRGPNVSQYIANLNQLSPPQDLLSEATPPEEDFSAFLNADLFDANRPVNFDDNLEFDVETALDNDQSQQSALGHGSRTGSIHVPEEPAMDFALNGDFQFTDFSNFGGPNHILDPSLQSLQHQHQQNHYPLPNTYSSPTSTISPVTPGFDQAAKKRKLDAIAPATQQSLDESARVAAEEDKRRRNTAASARFRVKKKQREQALEKTAKEMSDKVSLLESKVQQLETENAWLKSLITEKNGGKSSASELSALISKHEEGRSSPAHTDGVGTKNGGAKAAA